MVKSISYLGSYSLLVHDEQIKGQGGLFSKSQNVNNGNLDLDLFGQQWALPLDWEAFGVSPML